MGLPLYSFTFPIPTLPSVPIFFPFHLAHEFRHVLHCLLRGEDTLVEIGFRLVA